MRDVIWKLLRNSTEGVSMGVLRKLRRQKQKNALKAAKRIFDHDSMWIDEDGLHVVGACGDANNEFYEELTSTFQQNIMESELWDQIVEEYGGDKAKELLTECKAAPGDAQYFEPTAAKGKKQR